MGGYKTLREVCDCLDVTRRAVQGYEAIGLVHSSSTNKYGHLLYDDKAIETIKVVKQYQQFGFRLKEIKELQNVSNKILKEEIEKKIICLKEKQEELESIIEAANEMLEKLK